MKTAMSISTGEYSTQISELKTFINQERDARQVKKALAVKLLYQGHSHESVVRILDVSMGSVSNWKQAYETAGVGGFKPGHKGRQSYLSADDKAAVIGWLQQKDIWTLNELEYHLAEVYNVSYESSQSYYDLFEAAGLSWKKTSKINPKADAEVVAAKKQRSSGYWHATATR
jgi:putative transposase